MRTPRTPMALAAALSVLATAWSAGVGAQKRVQRQEERPPTPPATPDNLFLFVGGLQRSGTTWLEDLVSSTETSALSFENLDHARYLEQQPWRLQNHTQAYFEMVARVGGVEGKFVQDVYPYAYLVRDIGRNGHSIDGLLPKEEVLDNGGDGGGSARLLRQWSMWWDTSKPVLIEKTPENLLMGPFLQHAFGAQRTRFVFVMRHPLVWALAIEKVR